MVIIAPLLRITLPCYKYKESRRGTAGGFELVLSTLSERWLLIQKENGKVLAEQYFPWMDTDFWMTVSLRSDMKMQGWVGPNLEDFWSFMWVGPSAELRCPEQEEPVHSTPSAARPWRGGWGRAGGRQTPPGADWEGLTRHCPGQRPGCRPVNMGANVTDQNAMILHMICYDIRCLIYSLRLLSTPTPL